MKIRAYASATVIRWFMTMTAACAVNSFDLTSLMKRKCSDENARLEIYVTVYFSVVALGKALR